MARRYKHINRGTTYEVIGMGLLQTDLPLGDYAELVAYRCEESGDIWFRPPSEFTADRFTEIPLSPADTIQPYTRADLIRVAEAMREMCSDETSDSLFTFDPIEALKKAGVE